MCRTQWPHSLLSVRPRGWKDSVCVCHMMAGRGQRVGVKGATALRAELWEQKGRAQYQETAPCASGRACPRGVLPLHPAPRRCAVCPPPWWDGKTARGLGSGCGHVQSSIAELQVWTWLCLTTDTPFKLQVVRNCSEDGRVAEEGQCTNLGIISNAVCIDLQSSLLVWFCYFSLFK